jgi:polyhydroxybutyrate depolymerase
LQIHGTTDPVVNYNGLTQSFAIEKLMDFWRAKNTCTALRDTVAIANNSLTDGSTAQLIRNNSCSAGSKVHLFKITGGGHTWPGGAVDLPTNGNTNRDFNASQEIWRFFRQYSLSTPNAIGTVANIESALYPNPASGSITIQCSEIISSVDIYSITGAVAFSASVDAASIELNTANLDAGLYIAGIRTIDGSVVTKRFVKQ